MDYYYSDYYTTAPNNGGETSIIGLIIGVLAIVGLWKIFVKAGEEGWKSIIPIYSAYILFKIAGRNFWKYFILSIVLVISLFVMMFGSMGTIVGGFAGSSSAASGFGIATLISFVLFIVSAIWLIVEQAGLCTALSKNFGHGGGFAAGLFFLPSIFLIILGFNSDEYIGNGNSNQ